MPRERRAGANCPGSAWSWRSTAGARSLNINGVYQIVAYLSLYRRHRPLSFSEMTGQEHITRTLSNALSSGRLAHAYLFCGPRGTGKTTVAKILARSVNCDQYPAPEPCGTCPACKNIAAGVSMDVIEMDAASNRGIDEIRELRERTRYVSGENRFKVYIIDEAHMLTTEACNAFLKTLEEPPEKVIFILATTDPSRLPATIVSRCQRFDFHLLTTEQIRRRVEQILQLENRQSDREAVSLIARLADGSLRDALGILEQCSAYSEDHISAEHVRTVTGATMTDTIEALIGAALENNPEAGLELIEQVVYGGRDLQLLVRDLTFVFSRLLLHQEGGGRSEAEKSHGFEEVLEKYGGKLSRDLILEAVELLHEVANELRHARYPQFILEISFIRLLRVLHGSRPAMAAGSREGAEAIGVEKAPPETAAQETVPAPPARAKKPPDEKPAGTVPPQEPVSAASDSSASESPPLPAGDDSGTLSPESDLFSKLKQDWPRIIQELKKKQKSTAAWLEPARLTELRGRLVCLSYPAEYTIHQIRIMENSHRKLVEDVLSAFCHLPVNIKAELDEQVYASSAEGQAEDAVQESPGGEEKKNPPSAEEARQLFGGKLIDPD